MRSILKWLHGVIAGALLVGFLGGCALAPKKLMVKDMSKSYDAGTIIRSRTGSAVSFEDLVADLSTARVIYLGEKHNDPEHHKIQLDVIRALYGIDSHVVVGMEMFDTSYQPVLNLWSGGKLDEQAFLEKVHWYANWKYDFGLYKEILDFIKQENIRLAGLNIPFHIPAKISVGGIENLADSEKVFLPEQIELSNEPHREYVEKVFNHHQIPGREKFEFFYAAQCVWEDTMASSVAEALQADRMIVLAGNGHIIRKFGIPDRAFRRTGADFRTVYLAPAGSEVESGYADYIWVSPSGKRRPKMPVTKPAS